MTPWIKIVPSAKPLIAKYVLYDTLNYVLLDAITIAEPSITMGVLLHDRCWNKLLASKYGLSGLFRKMVYLPYSQLLPLEWASCQIRKIAGCACAGNAKYILWKKYCFSLTGIRCPNVYALKRVHKTFRNTSCIKSVYLGDASWGPFGFRSMSTSLRLRQDGRLLPDDIFKCIFLNENAQISIKISLKFVPKVQLTIFQHWLR